MSGYAPKRSLLEGPDTPTALSRGRGRCVLGGELHPFQPSPKLPIMNDAGSWRRRRPGQRTKETPTGEGVRR